MGKVSAQKNVKRYKKVIDVLREMWYYGKCTIVVTWTFLRPFLGDAGKRHSRERKSSKCEYTNVNNNTRYCWFCVSFTPYIA